MQHQAIITSVKVMGVLLVGTVIWRVVTVMVWWLDENRIH